MAFQRGRRSIRERYEGHFSPMEGREVRLHRTVSFVERGAVPQEFNRSFNDHQWFDAPQNYKDTREYHNKSYPCRDFPQPQHLGPYNQRGYKRRDLRHQLRNRRRPGASSVSPGQGACPPQRTMPDAKSKSQHSSLGYREDRWTPLPAAGRGHSPGSTETQSPVRSGSNTSSRSFSPDRDTGSPHQPALKKYKPNVPASHSPCSLVEEQPSSKEKTPASVAETEEVVAAGMEPELTPEEDFKARRLNAIKAKALEIEKHFRQDCETFCTVVKMLVAKEPALENLLQSSLDKNLLDIKQHCLADLRHFVKELDEVLEATDHRSLNTEF